MPDAKDQYYDSTYMRCLEWSYSQRAKVDGGYQGLWEGGNWELLYDGCRVGVWEDEKMLEMNGSEVMVVQHWECSKCH